MAKLFLVIYHPKPRQGVPRPAEAFVLCPAVLQPLPFRDGHGSYLTVSIAPLTRHALPTPILQASSRCSTSCSSRQPHKPKLLPFAATVTHRRCQRKRTPLALTEGSRPDNYLPLRRADNSSVNSAVVCSLRYSPSSGRWLHHRLNALL